LYFCRDFTDSKFATAAFTVISMSEEILSWSILCTLACVPFGSDHRRVTDKKYLQFTIYFDLCNTFFSRLIIISYDNNSIVNKRLYDIRIVTLYILLIP
jgi:hypothetical protein